ncbi:hypothetical protein POTOM_058977 [Populus tomentosa]|uniref:Response regulatory domain-containing protein n=1 Tax=Populus tomentosa TaxID=118781 RepID=A0A8X7Y1I7_POPTO|nr:hypothetical protein POTOM_058977 [Populus tomentosa]
MKMVFESGICSLQSSIIRNKVMASEEENNNEGKNSFIVLVVDDDIIIRMVTRELRAMGVKSTIVGVTSCTFEFVHKDFMEAGLNHCVAKPLIIAKIASFLPRSDNNKSTNLV